MTYSSPMIDTLIPVRTAALRIPLQLALGVLLMALLAQLEVNIGPVPITGQTLGVLLIGAAYGSGLGGLTLLAYLTVGGLGFGVFAGGGAGWSHFTGASAGYLVGFPFVAALIGHLAQANTEFTHPFMAARNEIRRIGYVVISSDRGLAGGLNSTMFRRILADMR